MSRFARPAHKRIARVIGYALTLRSAEGWWKASAVMSVSLKPEERAALAYAALTSLDERTAYATAEAALFQSEWPQ